MLYVLPIVGWAVLLYWFLKPGTKGANRFDHHPNGVEAEVFE